MWLIEPTALILILVASCQASPALSPSVLNRPSRRQASATDTRRRYYHGSFVLGSTLYIDGGECTTTDWERGNQVFNYTLAIDLSTTLSTNTSDDSSRGRLIDKGSCPNFNIAAYWPDEANQTVFIYGGEYSYLNPWIGPATVPPEELWAFTPQDGGSWNSIDQSFDTVFSTLTRPSYGGFASGSVGGFYFGGKHGSRGSQKTNIEGYSASSGVQFYNFTDQSWTNASSSGFYSGTYLSQSGGLQYVPSWGQSGLLVALGGQDFYTSQYFSWVNITIFDPATGRWYGQTASGDVPDPRWLFCNVGAGSQIRNGTYEIFVYGGSTGRADEAAAVGTSIYILSLPAFRWFQANVTSDDPRVYHTCNVAGKRQMLSVGGVNPTLNGTVVNGTSEQINSTDPYLFGLKVLDLASLTWTNSFDPAAGDYAAPQLVQDFYNGELKYPTRWNDNSLKDIFITPLPPPNNNNNNNNTSNSTASTPTPTSTSTPTPTPSPSPKGGTNAKAITGGVVGGVGGILLAVIGVWIFCFRRRKKAQTAGQASVEVEANHYKTDSNPVSELYGPLSFGGRTTTSGGDESEPRELAASVVHETDSTPVNELHE